jgi:putative peptidoglycan lipid II flippase
VALGTILLPSLSKLRAAGDQDAYSATLDWGLRLCWLLALPATVALAAIAEPIIATLLRYGHFSSHDVLMTQKALIGYAVGLMGLIVIKILAPAYYARQDIKTPVKIAFVSLAVTQALNIVLIGPMQHAGLALAISLGACLNAGLLFTGLYRSGVYRPQPGWPAFSLRLGIAVAVMAAVLLALKPLFGEWGIGLVWWRAAKLSLLIGTGAGAYFATLYALGFRLQDFNRRAA